VPLEQLRDGPQQKRDQSAFGLSYVKREFEGAQSSHATSSSAAATRDATCATRRCSARSIEVPIVDTGNRRADLLALARSAEQETPRATVERLLPRFLAEAVTNPALFDAYQEAILAPRLRQFTRHLATISLTHTCHVSMRRKAAPDTPIRPSARVEGRHCRPATPRNRLTDHCKHVSRRSWRSRAI